jgi:subtilase family serine protease
MQFPARYSGLYFFADLCGGWIRTVDPQTADVRNFATGITAPVDLSVSQDGALYYLARGPSGDAGVLYRIEATVGSGPNMRIPSFGAPKRGASGGTISLRDTTRNSGTAAAGATRTGFWFSMNKTLGNDVVLGTRPVPSLPPGASHKGTTSVTLPAVDAGTYYLIAQSDFRDAVSEIDETDNVAVQKIVIGADLVVSSLVTIPATPLSNAPTTIRVVIENAGGEMAPASTARLYRSVNGTIDGSDTQLRVFSVPPLAPKSSRVSEATLTLPAGTYYLIAAVDTGGTVNEANETNNTRKVKKTVR